MATAVIRKLDLKVGEIVEVDGKRYEVVPMRECDGFVLEPPITPMAELDEMWGTEPVSREEFDRLSADLPSDGEG
jgi:hypothetical protein